MLDQEEIGQQQKLLETHRRTLAHYIWQRAALGFLAPPGVTNGIHEAREDIRRIKATLREQDIAVEDHPDDKPHVLSSDRSKSVAALLAGVFALVGVVASVAALVQLVQYGEPLTATLPAVVVGFVWVGCIFAAFRSARYFFYAWVGAIGIPMISAIILGLNRLLQYEYDALTYLLLVIGAGVGTLICVYLAITSQEVRRFALSGLIAISLLSLGGTNYVQYQHDQLSGKIIILVATFDGPDMDYALTDTLLRNLRSALHQYDDVAVVPLGQTITEQNGGSSTARIEGEKRDANIVIWGWYRKTVENVSINATFEILNPTETLTKLHIGSNKFDRIVNISSLETFELQTVLSSETNYLTLFTLGMIRYEMKDWNGSIAYFNDAIDQTKEGISKLNKGTIYLFRGSAHAGNNDIDRAISDYTQAINLQSELFEAYPHRGFLYMAKGEFDHAIADFDQALQLKPDFAGYYLLRGVAYYYNNDYNRAIADFDQALQLKPDFAEAYYVRGEAYAGKVDYEQAISNFDQALKLQPTLAEAYSGRGNAYIASSDLEHGIEDLNQAIQIQPDNADFFYNRAIAYVRQNNYDHAIADYTLAINLNPEFYQAYINRGGAYHDVGDYGNAITDFTQAINLKITNSAVAYNSRGLTYYAKGDYDQAIADFTQAINFKQDAAEYFNRGNVYFKTENYDRAIDDFSQAIYLLPNLDMAYYIRGESYIANEAYDRAIDDFNNYIRLNPDNAEAYNQRGLAFLYKNSYNHAISDFSQAIQFKPDIAEYYNNRGVSYAKEGNKELSIIDFRKVLELTTDPALRKQAQDQLKALGTQ